MHRLKVDFDELSIVHEEDELAKLKDSKESEDSQSAKQGLSKEIQDVLSFYSIPYETPSSDTYPYSPEFPFLFPSPGLNYPNQSPEIPLLIPPCPPMYANDNVGSLRPDSAVGSGVFPSVSDLDNSSSEASVQTRSTKVISSPNLPKLGSIGDNASSIPKSSQPDETKVEFSSKPKHFFAPLTVKLPPQQVYQSSEKGSADICIKEIIPENQKSFFSSENLISEDERSSRNLVKSLSCHDIPKSEASSVDAKCTKSENALDHKESFRSKLNITLQSPLKSASPSTPEVPQLPSFDSKLFSNQYHQHFEQYRNYMAQAMKQPLKVQIPEPSGFCPGFYGFIPMPSKSAGKSSEFEQYQAMLLNGKIKSPKDIQVTSFETPSPRTLQVPPMSPYDLNVLYSKIPGMKSDTPDLFHSLPLLTKDGKVVCPNSAGLKVHCEACLKKAPVQTPEDESDKKKLRKKISSEGTSSSSSCQKKKLKQQVSITSSDVPETPTDGGVKRVEDKESRSSSSGGESPRKEPKKINIYVNPKKRPSVSSTRTNKSLSLDVGSDKHGTGLDVVDSTISKDKNGKNGKEKKRERRNSSSSETAVPWCACWGNGCI